MKFKKLLSLVIAAALISASSAAYATNKEEINSNLTANIMIEKGYLKIEDNRTVITKAYEDYALEYAEENNLTVQFTENSVTYSPKALGGETKIE